MSAEQMAGPKVDWSVASKAVRWELTTVGHSEMRLAVLMVFPRAAPRASQKALHWVGLKAESTVQWWAGLTGLQKVAQWAYSRVEYSAAPSVLHWAALTEPSMVVMMAARLAVRSVDQLAEWMVEPKALQRAGCWAPRKAGR